jgi:hypothetical protein
MKIDAVNSENSLLNKPCLVKAAIIDITMQANAK